MHVFTIPADKWDETNPDKQAIRHLIMKHRRSYERLKGLKNYYEGRHKILDEDRENRLVCNHAKDIVNCEHDAIGNMAVAFVGTSGVQMGWLASQADMLADDWMFVE